MEKKAYEEELDAIMEENFKKHAALMEKYKDADCKSGLDGSACAREERALIHELTVKVNAARAKYNLPPLKKGADLKEISISAM